MTTSSQVQSQPGGGRALRSPAPSRLSGLTISQVLKASLAAVGILALGVAYLAQARTVPTTSEGGSQALQAWDMLHGNLLLRGWSLSDVSFYTTELPEYMLVEAVHGLDAATVPVAAALSYLLQVLMAGWLARGHAEGREARMRMLVAAGIMLAPSTGPATSLLMSSPDHVGTHVPLLAIYLVLDRVRPRWWLPVLVTALLAWAQIGDTLVVFEGALPLLAVSAVRMLRRRGPLAGQWYDLSLAAGALASVGMAKVAVSLIGQAGGFTVNRLVVAFATPVGIAGEFWTKLQNMLMVFGADIFGAGQFGSTLADNVLAALAAAVHLIGVCLAVWAVTRVVRHCYAESGPVVQMLALTFVLVVGAYLFGSKPDPNEIVGLLPIGAVLAGRVLGNTIIERGHRAAAAVVLTCCAVLLVSSAQQAPRLNLNQRVAAWLQAHHLRYGLAGFWDASSISVETGDRVMVRPVRTYQDEVVTTNRETDSSWYDPKLHYADFVVWTSSAVCANACLTEAGLAGGFGRPAAAYQVGSYLVLVYHRNLLRSVPEVAFCGKSWPWIATGQPSRNLRC
ncbi:MAG TPA: hypothetical protein VNF47_20075 [Streptosporangiaceae bacterium]|nr:hypothetical protein [Streptosporangiaceae bacterium]